VVKPVKVVRKSTSARSEATVGKLAVSLADHVPELAPGSCPFEGRRIVTHARSETNFRNVAAHCLRARAGQRPGPGVRNCPLTNAGSMLDPPGSTETCANLKLPAPAGHPAQQGGVGVAVLEVRLSGRTDERCFEVCRNPWGPPTWAVVEGPCAPAHGGVAWAWAWARGQREAWAPWAARCMGPQYEPV
jgi:hypothetical protein